MILKQTQTLTICINAFAEKFQNILKRFPVSPPHGSIISERFGNDSYDKTLTLFLYLSLKLKSNYITFIFGIACL
jgi:hypothetical protein